jgi:hypothetical protein
MDCIQRWCAIDARSFLLVAWMTVLAAGCASVGEATSQESRPVPAGDAIGKVVDSLAAETAQRLTTDPYRNLPVVVRAGTGSGTEPVVAELLRTRLLERGIAVEVACPAKCLEVSLIEYVSDAAASGGLSAGQVLNVAAGAVPGLGGVPRTGSERAAGRSVGLLVSFAARDGNRYLARNHAVAVLAASGR